MCEVFILLIYCRKYCDKVPKPNAQPVDVNYHNKVEFIDSPCWLQLSEQMGADGHFSVFVWLLFVQGICIPPSHPLIHHPSTTHHPTTTHSNPPSEANNATLLAKNLFKARLSIYSTFTHLMMGFASPCLPNPWSLVSVSSSIRARLEKVSKCQSKDLKMCTLNVLYCGKRSLSECVCCFFVNKL